MRSELHRAAVFLIGCLGALAAPASGQCRSWSAGLAAPALPVPGALAEIECFDDGAGPKVYCAGSAQVSRWNGRRWEPVFVSALPGYGVKFIRSTADAGTPVLLVLERDIVSPIQNTSYVWRWDGASWTQLGSLPYAGTSVGYFDDGGGTSLFAIGTTSSPVQSYVSRWNGTSWTQVGAALSGSITDIASAVLGGVPRLFVSGPVDLVPSSSVAFWNGSAWTLAYGLDEPVTAICSFDPGSGERLYAGLLLTTGATLRAFDGASWSSPVAITGLVQALEVADLGAGPRLLIAGAYPQRLATYDGASLTPLGISAATSSNVIHTAVCSIGGVPHVFANGTISSAGSVTVNGFAEWNGTSWSALGQGLFPSASQAGGVNGLTRFDFGAGEELVAVGSFDGAGAGPTGLACVARWNGSAWAALGAGVGTAFDSRIPYVVQGVDFGTGPRLFMGGHWMQATNQRGLLEWNGSSWVRPVPAEFGDVLALAAFPASSGTQLAVGGQFTTGGGAPGNNVFAFNGNVGVALGAGTNGIVGALATFDEGSGTMLFAGGSFSQAGGLTTGRIARWNGSAWSAVGTGIPNGGVNALCAFQGSLYVGGTFTSAGGLPVNHLARWNGSAWSDVPGSGPNGAVLALHVHDDGRGPALYVGGGFSTIGGILAYDIARFDGSGWEAVDGGLDNVVRAFASVDDDGDGDRELFAGGTFLSAANVSSGRIARLEGCPRYESFCFGDGTLADHTTPCPCANTGAAGRGCANSFDPNGALLTASGQTDPETLVLAGSGMPLSAFGTYLQHDAQDDRVFHDGVICAGGNLIRLRNRTAVGGASTYPDSTDTQTISQRGMVAPSSGALRYYSLFYRSASPTFCPPATANVTNGMRVIW